MQRPTAALLVSGMLILAGCGSLPVINNQDQTSTPVPQPEANSNSDPSADTRTPYDMSVNTGEIVLRLSDLPSGYEFGGETNQSQTSEGDTGTQLREQSILRQHQRSFRYNGTDTSQYPPILISSVIIYEDTNAAENQFQQAVANLTTGNATAENREVVSGSTATVVKFRNQRDGYVVLVYSQNQNMGFYIATLSANRYREEFTVDQYIKMLVDV